MKRIFILAALVLLCFAIPAVASPPEVPLAVQVVDQAVSIDLGVYTVESAPVQEAPAPEVTAFELYVSTGNAPTLAGLMQGAESSIYSISSSDIAQVMRKAFDLRDRFQRMPRDQDA